MARPHNRTRRTFWNLCLLIGAFSQCLERRMLQSQCAPASLACSTGNNLAAAHDPGRTGTSHLLCSRLALIRKHHELWTSSLIDSRVVWLPQSNLTYTLKSDKIVHKFNAFSLLVFDFELTSRWANGMQEIVYFGFQQSHRIALKSRCHWLRQFKPRL